ncbi:hypothetical protein [Rickettsia hoogstraalii]|uniref:hypothetical protein n=1 Tax=Rickettsia hoogstraalii TaxID=467174 RepID=UPI000AC57FD8|nr:hypothetical protein [Rickettsia hoogstraalii]
MPAWIPESSLRGIVAWILKVVIASSRRRRGNLEKIIKKFCKSEFFTGLLRQLLCNFLAMTIWVDNVLLRC